MAFAKGTLILINYTARIKESGEVFDTTIEDDARNNALDNVSLYEPKLVSVGDSWVSKGLDEALVNATVGEQLSVEVPPDKGFGQRDPSKVRMIPIRKLGDDAEKVTVGDEVEIDKRKGVIRFIGSGRVRIDYNHKYAGKTIVYDVNVIRSLDSDNEKIEHLLRRHLRPEDAPPEFEIYEDKELEIEIPSELFRIDGLQTIKNLIKTDMFKFIPHLQSIDFIETFENPTPIPKSTYDEPKESTYDEPKESTYDEPKESTYDESQRVHI